MISRRNFLRYVLPVIGAGLTSAGYGFLVEPFRVSVEKVNLPIARLPLGLEGLKIVALTDFHLQPLTKIEHIQHAVKVANTLDADIVVLLGDFVDSTVHSIHELAPALAQINAKYGIYAVLGNHDYWNNGKVVRAALEKAGIIVFENQGLELPIGKDSLFLAGLESVWGSEPNLRRAMEKHRAELPTVLLMHEPDYADVTSLDPRIAVQLSGHSHGGQVRIPGLGPLRLPSWGIKYNQGLYSVKDMLVYTNRGIGVTHIPVRFNCPPEITQLTLRVK